MTSAADLDRCRRSTRTVTRRVRHGPSSPSSYSHAAIARRQRIRHRTDPRHHRRASAWPRNGSSWRTQIPSIILLLVAGLLLGPVSGVIDPDEFLGGTLFPIVSISRGADPVRGRPRPATARAQCHRHRGPTADHASARSSRSSSPSWGAERLFDISRGAAAVLAAVLVVTGPTVVGPLLRFVRPNGRTGPMLRAEGILIDPIGATASLVAFEAALTNEPGEALTTILRVIGLTLVAGHRHRVPGGVHPRPRPPPLPDPRSPRQPDRARVRRSSAS